ncbi:betaine-aldehyde dehydrogenase [Arhodomonas sp. KWT2]|uniref:betaine-aldehyde dehydrogenase n=2 Tax=unclassified Arhodomonas TaxID=2621637 RepID=UPI0035BF078D
MTQQPEAKLWIDGAAVDATSAEQFDNINPATGAVLNHVGIAGGADVERAVASARAGQRQWAAMTGTERGRVLQRASMLLREHRDELARLESLDGGKPIAETPEADVDSGADCLEYFAGQAASLTGDYQAVDGGFYYARPEPLGVCAGIGAWNYPLQIACWKAAPALAAGNAMVFKPAELTPLSAFRVAQLFTEAGLPDGVFNVIQGEADTGRALVAHPGVAKVSLTGEAGTGKAVMRDAAAGLKAVTMELGGKSPLIVFDDADLDNAVSGALLGNFYTQGEICTNGTRVFVHESVMDDFLSRLLERTRRLRIGDPMDPETDVGAMISAGHMEHVLGYIERGRAEGAELLAGGGRATVPGCEGGYYVEPTVFGGCSDDMTIVREEIFGPVMSVLAFRDEAEVIERANATDYGLAGGVFTRDITRGHRVAAELEAGVVWVNHYNLTPIEMPFGGVKHSGLGRENSHHALEHYTRLKSVFVATADVEAPY